MNTFRTRLEIAQNSSFQCEHMIFYHSSNTITSPVKKTHKHSHFVCHSLSFCKLNDCLYQNWTLVKLLQCERMKAALGLMITPQSSWQLTKVLARHNFQHLTVQRHRWRYRWFLMEFALKCHLHYGSEKQEQ